jgi:methionyl-tRNA formyltransferase
LGDRGGALRIVFFGTPRTAVPSLGALLDAGQRVTLVVTRPDRPAGRSDRLVAPPVKLLAERRGVAVIQPAQVRGPEFAERLEAERPDAIVTVAYGKILPAAVLRIPALGCVNLHFSLLPRFRGAAPIQWALAAGESATGATTMRMNERLDEGDILLQEPVAIAPDEHAPELAERMAHAGARLLVETLARLQRGELVPRPQVAAEASHAPLLTRADGVADFALPARLLEGRVRGFDPWPGVWAKVNQRRLRIRRARAVPGAATSSAAGTVLGFEREALQVACGAGTVLDVLVVQPESGRELSARDARNGRVLAPGDRLEGASSGA